MRPEHWAHTASDVGSRKKPKKKAANGDPFSTDLVAGARSDHSLTPRKRIPLVRRD